MAFPTTSVLDTFTGITSGQTLPAWSANWHLLFSSNDLVGSTSDGFKVLVGNVDTHDYWTTAFGPDCEAFVDLVAIPEALVGRYVALYLRVTNPNLASITGYEVDWTDGTGWQISRMDSSSVFVRLGAAITGQDPVNGDSFGAEIVGSTINLYRKTGGTWSLIGSRTDATYGAAGFIGVESNAASGVYDNFGGGTSVVVADGVPNADVTDGGWTNEAGSNVNLFASIDEATANDADFIQSGLSPSSVDLAEIGLSVIVP